MVKSNAVLMAEYNQWMNTVIYESAATLSSAELSKDRGAFFGSIIGTLNHIVVADIIWLKRFALHPAKFSAIQTLHTTPLPEKLNAIIFDNLALLREERVRLDRLILDFAHQLTEQALRSELAYTNTKGIAYTKPFGHLIQHFFNHQTHHRGQISTLLSQLGVDIGETDLLVKIPNV